MQFPSKIWQRSCTSWGAPENSWVVRLFQFKKWTKSLGAFMILHALKVPESEPCRLCLCLSRRRISSSSYSIHLVAQVDWQKQVLAEPLRFKSWSFCAALTVEADVFQDLLDKKETQKPKLRSTKQKIDYPSANKEHKEHVWSFMERMELESQEGNIWKEAYDLDEHYASTTLATLCLPGFNLLYLHSNWKMSEENTVNTC